MNIAKNGMALIRGNLKCLIKKIFHRKCRYSNYIRIKSNTEIEVNKAGSFEFGRGVLIGKRVSLKIRENAKFIMGNMSAINDDCKIVCHEFIKIGDNTIIGPNVMIFDHDHIFNKENGVMRKEYKCKKIIIGKNCWIGAGAIILRGTEIGDNSVVGAGAIVKGIFKASSKIVGSTASLKD